MKKSLQSWLLAMSHGRYADLGLLFLRLVPAILMAFTHGFDKLKKFDELSGKFMDFMGLGPSFSLALVIFAEFFCSLLLIAGFFTRLATIPLFITMAVVVFDVNAGAPIFKIEPPILYMVAFLVLFITGAGKYSLDYKIFHKPALNM